MTTLIRRLETILLVLYVAFILILPVVAVVVVVKQADVLGVSDGAIDFLLRSFFLVALFNLFFMVLYHEEIPRELGQLSGLLFGPIIAALGHWAVAGTGFWLALAETGMIYTIEIMLAFIILMTVIFGLGVMSAIYHKDLATLGSGIFLCALQLLFLIPGGGAAYIFGKVLWAQILVPTAEHYGALSVVAIISYSLLIVPIVQNIWTFFKHLKDESIIG